MSHQNTEKWGRAKAKTMTKGYASGGRVKPITINIISAPRDEKPTPLPVPPIPMGPPPGPPGGGPLPMPPGGGPMGAPGPMGMKRGGRIKKAEGGKVQNAVRPADTQDYIRHRDSDYEFKKASGGRVPMTAGAESGPGRLQKIRAYGKKAKGG